MFCDFGENFTVLDMTGEQPISVIISSVTKETKSVVTCSDETRHNFESGDYVTFTEVGVSVCVVFVWCVCVCVCPCDELLLLTNSCGGQTDLMSLRGHLT